MYTQSERGISAFEIAFREKSLRGARASLLELCVSEFANDDAI